MKNLGQGNILTNDPSITAWGWAVLTPSGQVIEAGAIKTQPSNSKKRIRKADDRVRRISEINFQLISLIEKYDVKLILSELPHGSQSAVAATMIGMVAGVVQTMSDCFGVPVEWYSENDAKRAVSGRNSVAKEKMIELISKLYTVTWTGTKWIDEAMADALAVYHVATQQSSLLKMIRQQ